MSMTRKDYEADAKELNNIMWNKHTEPGTIVTVMLALGSIRADANPLFDMRRWMKACLKDQEGAPPSGWEDYLEARRQWSV